MKTIVVGAVAILVVLTGCAGNSGQVSNACRTAIQTADTLLLAAADGMVAHQDFLEATLAGDTIKASAAVVRIEKSNDAVDSLGSKYLESRSACVGEKV